MRLSMQTDFALRVLIYLSVHTERRVRVKEIADAYAISHHHLTKVVQQLQRSGYLITHRGKGGGIELAKSTREINIGGVVREFESATHLVECFAPGNRCVITPVCELKLTFAEAYEAFLSSLDSHILADLLSDTTCDLRELFAVKAKPPAPASCIRIRIRIRRDSGQGLGPLHSRGISR